MTEEGRNEFNREQEIKRTAKTKTGLRELEKENTSKEKVENNTCRVSGKMGNEPSQKSFKDIFGIDETLFNRYSCKVEEVWYEGRYATVRIIGSNILSPEIRVPFAQSLEADFWQRIGIGGRISGFTPGVKFQRLVDPVRGESRGTRETSGTGNRRKKKVSQRQEAIRGMEQP